MTCNVARHGTGQFGGANAGIISTTTRTGGKNLQVGLELYTDSWAKPGEKTLGGYSYGLSNYTLTVGGPIIAFKSTKYPMETTKLVSFIMDPKQTPAYIHGGLWMPNEKRWYSQPDLLADLGGGFQAARDGREVALEVLPRRELQRVQEVGDDDARPHRRDLPVLLMAEPGAGKHAAARLLHEMSPRKTESFQAVCCADLTPQLLIASASLWVWPYRNSLKAVTAVLGVLCTFHTGLFISLSLAGDQQAGQIIHAVMAVLCIVLFTQRAKWCE